jgi:hypothetical protein
MKKKYFFWFILGSLSVFFAEVVSGSTIFPFFSPWGILVVFPLYTLHTLILVHLVFRFGKPDIYKLFLAGAVFGLYEAYITKVLWEPPWGPQILIGGVGVFQLLVLVFFWHPFMSFIIPVLLGETFLTGSREVIEGMPGWFYGLFKTKKRAYASLLIFTFFCGVSHAVNSPSSEISMLSGVSNTAIIIGLIYIWRYKGLNTYSFRELMPSKREFRVLFILLISMYAVLSLSINREAIPEIHGQLSIWLLYVFFGFLLYRNLRLSDLKRIHFPVGFSYRLLILFAFLFSIISSTTKSVSFIALAFWPIGVFSGLLIFIQAVLRVFRRRKHIFSAENR